MHQTGLNPSDEHLPLRRVDGDAGLGVDDRRAKPDRRPVSLADSADAQDGPNRSGIDTALVGMGHSGRIGDAGALHGVLLGEARADQHAPVVAEVLCVQDGRESVNVLEEHLLEALVTAPESGSHLGERHRHLLVVERHHPRQDGVGPRPGCPQVLLSGHEEAQRDPAGIGTDPNRRSCAHQPPPPTGPVRPSSRTVPSRPAVSAVSIAIVDSAPWLRLAPSDVSPS